jgi:N-acetylglucosaminyldiphosphoundecaprenol N-acetyl-beta-D-mannosaminyltransferase
VTTTRGERVEIGTLSIDPLSEAEVVERVRTAWRAGDGGWIATPNVDHLRAAAADPRLRELIGTADLCVADGAPVVWAARLSGRPLPERVTGADLLWSLCAAAAEDGRSIYLLGGDTGVPERAAEELQRRYPGLQVAGSCSPPFGFEKDDDELRRCRDGLAAAHPDVVFVGLGFPKQEQLIQRFDGLLPNAWWLGCGAAIPFAAGDLARAPQWMRRTGLEWFFRLVSEPRRLFRRYILDDLPYAVRLLAWAVATRLRSRSITPRRSSAGSSRRRPR